jgi:putative tryptophan/tyrosine transport system substrate-binding protein
MRRREFISLLSGAAAAPAVLWQNSARAQQVERVRRVGILMNAVPEDSEGQSYVAAFQQGMQELGWSVGGNLRIDLRWGGTDSDRWRRYAGELVGLSPDVIVAAGGVIVAALQRASRTVPIVFAQAIDPVGAGIVASLARPGGNATGFAQFEYGLSSKWPELLKEIAPGLKRVGVLREPANAAGIGQWAIIQTTASALGMEVFPLGVRDPDEIERGIAGFSREPDGGLIAAVGSGTTLHRGAIISSAARHRLPVVYAYRYFVAAGGLISYGPDLLSQYRRAAGYVDRILKGEKPASLPVQTPTKYETVINLKTAKALGLTVPPSVLARADEAIE